jgi:hypothetical protein
MTHNSYCNYHYIVDDDDEQMLDFKSPKSLPFNASLSDSNLDVDP